MRKADIITAIIILLYCLFSLVEATKLKIGWVKKVGPGGGFLPFWLIIMIGICALIVLFQVLFSKERSTEPFFISEEGQKSVAKVLLAVIGCVVAYAVVGCYFGSIAFIAFYMRYIGRRSWVQTSIVSISVPFGIWFMFEYFLKITLPKGLPIVENLWYAFMPT